MSKVKILMIAVVALIALNLFLVGSRILGPKPKGPPKNEKRAENLLIEKLQFSDAQAEQFKSLKKEHQQSVERIQKDLNNNQKAFFDLLKNDTVRIEEKERLNYAISKKINELNELHFDHFQDIKNIGSDDQKELFVNFIEEMSRRFISPQGDQQRPPRPPKKKNN